MKNCLKQFIIPFSGLQQGIHEWDFKIENTFFDALEYSEVKKGKVQVKVIMDKQSNLLVLKFELKGVVSVECDRCLDEMDQPIASEQRLIVKLSDQLDEESDEMMVLPAGEHKIDVAPLIYEYIILAIPIRHVHPNEKECNQDVMKKLKEHSNQQETDPRWDSLKNIIN